jgi:hypothetical protein
MTGYWLDGWGLIPGRGQDNFLYSTAFRPALGSTQSPVVQWVPEALSVVVKRPGRQGDHSPPPSVEIKNSGALRPLSHMS